MPTKTKAQQPTVVPVVSFKPRRHDVWIEMPLAPGWVAALRLGIGRSGGKGRRRGQLVPVIGELRVFPTTRQPGTGQLGTWRADVDGVFAAVPSGGLTWALLRQVRLNKAQRGMNALLSLSGLVAWKQQGLGYVPPAPKTPRPRRRRPQVGRPATLSNRDYVRLAKRYVELLEAGLPPVKTLATELGLPRSTVSRRIDRCRVKKLLLGGAPCRAGGAVAYD
jgi:hypothetical protein